MKLSIKVDGELVRQGLENLAAEIPQIGRRRIRTVMNAVVRETQGYPAERPGQTYRRTGTLFSHFKIEEIESGYAISNTAQRKGRQYAQYVIGDAYGTSQAWFHRGRWSVLRNVVDEKLKTLPAEIEQDIIMVARRVGL